jgi:hypothetical protein
MNISSEYTAAIESLGYTSDEARFLYIAATFSGYFVPRQFVAFAGAKWGSRSTNFTRKLESRGHVSWREYPHLNGVYHLSSSLLYRLIGKESLRNHRRHSPDFICTRLLVLDFILANRDCEYLETEADKVSHFHGKLGIPEKLFPTKEFARHQISQPTVRYFVDQFPMYFATAEGGSPPLLTLSYVDPGRASLAGFGHHLRRYKSLLASLSAFGFVYISNTSAHFMAAQERFSAFIADAFREEISAALLSYFTLRVKWDQKRYEELSMSDIKSLELASRQFNGPGIERLYLSWCAAQRSTGDGGNLLPDSQSPRNIRFECCLVSRDQVARKEVQIAT